MGRPCGRLHESYLGTAGLGTWNMDLPASQWDKLGSNIECPSGKKLKFAKNTDKKGAKRAPTSKTKADGRAEKGERHRDR